MKTPSGNAGGNGRNGNAIRTRTLERLKREEREAAALDRKQLHAALTAFQKGSFDVRLPEDWIGLDGNTTRCARSERSAGSRICRSSR